MHVRFSGTMLVSPSRTPSDDVFERKDNYYVYLKPFDITDEAVLKRMRFSGKPPVSGKGLRVDQQHPGRSIGSSPSGCMR